MIKSADELINIFSESSENRPVILFIDDNEDMRNYMKHLFNKDYIFLDASGGAEGIYKAFEYVPDIIICDILMPVMDGFEVCRKIKSDGRTRHIPVILLTAKGDGESKVNGLIKGADDYIVKPFDNKELILKVKNNLTKLEHLREKFEKEFLLNNNGDKIKSQDNIFLTDLINSVIKNIDDPSFGVSELSKEMGFSRAQLFRKLKAISGKGPSDFIRIIRLKKAAELLSKNTGNISEVAYSVGFNNLSYFTKCFQAAYKKTPSDYIGRIKNNN